MSISRVDDSTMLDMSMEKATRKKVETFDPTGKGADLVSSESSDAASALDSISYGPPELSKGGVFSTKG